MFLDFFDFNLIGTKWSDELYQALHSSACSPGTVIGYQLQKFPFKREKMEEGVTGLSSFDIQPCKLH